MKILILISNPEMGGAQRVAFNFATWIDSTSDHSAQIVALRDTKKKQYDFGTIRYVSLHGKNKIKNLKKILLQDNPDVMLSMGVPLCLYSVPACMGTGIKHIVSERNDPRHFAGKFSTKVLSRLLMRLADGYVFQTKDAQNYYNSLKKKSTIIHNPLFGLQSMPSSQFDGEREKVIVSMGRLNPQKNQSLLIEAFAQIQTDFPSYKLVIYGEGPERDKLEQLIAEKHIEDRVLLPGAVSNIHERICNASLFVLSSDFEGMPNALMEAMALGLPCISTDCPCGGPAELIEQNKNGVLVSVGNKEKLANAMNFMLTNRSVSEEIGRKAMEIRQTHNVDDICKEWISFFSKITNQ